MGLQEDIEDFYYLVKEDTSILNNVVDYKFLLAFIRVHPEFIEDLEDETVLKMSNFADPYNNQLEEDTDEKLSFSYINFKNETIMRMQMLGVIAYMYQSVQEYGLKTSDMYVDQKKMNDPELIEKKKHITEFLDYIFKYDPLRHVKDCYAEYKDKEMSLKNKKLLIPPKVTKEITKMMTDPVHNPVAYEEVVRKEFIKEVEKGKLKDTSADFIQYMKDQKTPEKASNVLSSITANAFPPIDLFSNYDRFFNLYFNEIYGLTHLMFGLSSKINFAINPYKVLESEKECEKFEEQIGPSLTVPITSVHMNSWTYLGPWRQNSANVRFQLDTKSKEVIDVNRMMQTPNYNKVRNEMVKKKTQAIKKERELTEEDKRALRAYGENMGMSDLIEDAMNTESEDLPDDALEYNVIHVDAATGETNTGRLHLKDKVY